MDFLKSLNGDEKVSEYHRRLAAQNASESQQEAKVSSPRETSNRRISKKVVPERQIALGKVIKRIIDCSGELASH